MIMKLTSKQNVIVRVAHSRPRLISTSRTARIFPVYKARMVAGQSTSAAGGEEKTKSDVRSYANTSMIENMKKKKKSINLLRGWPSTSLLPAPALRAASQTALSDPSIWAPGLEYGPDPGYQPLREALARWLGRFYGDVIPTTSTSAPDDPAQKHEEDRRQDRNRREVGEKEADRITITGGASQSLACLFQSFTDPAYTLAVWVVAPCYFLACPIFEDSGFAGRLRAVPEDAEGADIVFLEREMLALEKREEEKRLGGGTRGEGKKDGKEDGHIGPKYKDPGRYRKIYRHVVYCVPAFSNPSGRTMTLARREGLVELARKHDALVICDDIYDMLQWHIVSALLSSPPPSSSLSSPTSQPSRSERNPLHTALLPRIADLDIARGPSPHDPADKHFGHAVSNGSFSKLVAPGTRTGWTYSTADFATGLSQTGSTRSGGAASQLAATIVCELLLPIPSTTPSTSASTSTPSKQHEHDQPNPTQRGNEKGEKKWECELDIHIRHILLPSYARRHGILTRAIREVLVPLGVRFAEDSLCGHRGVYGGYFVWMTLPPHGTGTTTTTTTTTTAWPSAQAIADRCRADEDLMIGNGELFAVYGDEEAARFGNAIRLCFAWEDEEDLVDGVQRLGRVMRAMLDEGPEKWGVGVAGLGDVDVDQAK
ncbi:pyridoxal phosphate-dependent transferase [Xylaria sp. FL1042]|nr:pyridoxal phosphate-dependent transferase [Xylaria sp. FL1042]